MQACKIITCIIILFKFQVYSLKNGCEPAGLNDNCATCGKCRPGLFCNDAKICEIEKGTCNSYQWTDDKWKPSCDEDGSFSAVQCKGEYLNGRCFCFSPKGERIFGWSWWDTKKKTTCACSRRENELKKQRGDVSLHCTEDGNYEKLQCDNGLCWCVEPTTGEPTQRVYPQTLMTYLPCYNKKDIGLQYLRRCESKSVARAKILEKIEYHNLKFFHIENILCNSDGSYGHYHIDRNIVRCTWKNGKSIDNYQTAVNNIATVNCNCARDLKIYAEANLDFRLICQTNGNYEPNQYSNGYPFCVDKDGFATTDLGELGENLNCRKF